MSKTEEFSVWVCIVFIGIGSIFHNASMDLQEKEIKALQDRIQELEKKVEKSNEV